MGYATERTPYNHWLCDGYRGRPPFVVNRHAAESLKYVHCIGSVQQCATCKITLVEGDTYTKGRRTENTSNC